MKRRLLLAITALVAILAFAAPAFAAPAETETIVQHGVTESFSEAICEGGTVYDIDLVYNSIEHVTATDDGFHVTFTEAGRFEATDPNTGEVFTGHFAVWGGFNENPGGEVDGTFTFNVAGRGDQGSRVSVHQVEHFDATPNGTVHEFFKSVGCD